MTVILGPCPCQKCGERLWWVRRWHDDRLWVDASGLLHWHEQ
jgi:hypothetical protein